MRLKIEVPSLCELICWWNIKSLTPPPPLKLILNLLNRKGWGSLFDLFWLNISEDSYVCVDPPDEPAPDLDYSLADEIQYVCSMDSTKMDVVV